MERMTEAEIEGLLTEADRYHEDDLADFPPVVGRLVKPLAAALRQVREDLTQMQARVMYKSDLASEWRDELIAWSERAGKAERERDAAREDAKNYAYNLDQFRLEADRLRESIEDLRFRGFTVDLLPGSMTTGDPPTIEYRGKAAGFVPTTVQRLLLSWKADIAALAASGEEAK